MMLLLLLYCRCCGRVVAPTMLLRGIAETICYDALALCGCFAVFFLLVRIGGVQESRVLC